MKRNYNAYRGMTKIELLVVLGILVILVMLLIPDLDDPGSVARRRQCSHNLKQLALGFHVYHDEHGTLPPPSGSIVPEVPDDNDEDEPEVADENVVASEPTDWSWRVRILPLIEEQEQFDKFRFDEPWDSEHNLTVAETMPYGYWCPADPREFKEINGHQIPLTNYVMITGPNTVCPTDGTVRTLSDITDKKGETLMIVEVWGESRPAWIEPIDMTLEDLARGVNSESGMSISGDHISRRRMKFFDDEYGGVNVCFADGSVRLLQDENMTGEELQFMAIINDGKDVDWD